MSGDRSGRHSDVAENALAGAATYFKNGDYGKAAEIYQAFPNNNQALYALGHTYYKGEKYQQAVNTFKKLVAKNSLEYQEQAEWYLLLSYLAVDQTGADFQTLLDKIIADGGFYNKKAQAIKDDVGSIWR